MAYPYLDENSTQDLQYDLAMFQADGEQEGALASAMIAVLHERHVSLPTNARWVYDPYAPFKKRLLYDLA